MMNILGWVLFGFVVGLIARAVMPERFSIGLVGTTFLGIVGALLAGWVGQAIGWYAPNEAAGFVSATAGAVVVLAVYYWVSARGTGRGRRRGSISPIDLESDRKSDSDHKDRWVA